MGNEQQGSSSHHFIMNTSKDENKQQEKQSPSWTKTERISITKQIPITTTKPSWQIARDKSMDILSRKSTKLSLKQGTPPNFTSQRSIIKKHSLHERSTFSRSSHLHRIPRMPTEKEAAQVAISYDLLCSYCEDLCIGDYIRCRICTKTYHSQCLFQRGHLIDQTFSLRRHAKQDWSCPECRDLTRLLNQDELHYLMHAFEKIDQNNDGYITLEEFLSFKLSDGFELFFQHNYDLGKKYFSLMDSTQKGVVTWSDFAFLYSCKLIAAKNKIELTTKLTDKELVIARNLFFKDPKKTFDNEFNIIITKEYFDQVYYDFIVLLKKKYGIHFIDVVLGDDHYMEDKSEKFSVMNWSEYLREISLLILLNRSNDDIICNQIRRASIPAHLLNASVVSRSIFPSIEINPPSRLTFTRSYTPGTPILPSLSCDDSFRKHAKILEKLNQRNQQEDLKRKQMGSSIDFIIIENIDEEENINLPKLKLNARDDRKTITDPWTSVNEMQQLRNQPILIKTSVSNRNLQYTLF